MRWNAAVERVDENAALECPYPPAARIAHRFGGRPLQLFTGRISQGAFRAVKGPEAEVLWENVSYLVS